MRRLGDHVALVVSLTALVVALGGTALAPGAGAADARLTAMTWNLYVGAPFALDALPADPGSLAAAADSALASAEASDVPGRMDAVARRVAASRPDVIGLQELAVWRVQEPGDGFITPASEIRIDALASLGASLRARGLRYRVAALSTNADLEVTGASGRDVRLTDRDAVLVRADRPGLRVLRSGVGRFARNLVVASPVGLVTVPRGWAFADVRIGGRPVRMVTTHLEPASAAVRLAQAREIARGPAGTRAPVVVLGDFNARPGAPAYRALTRSGLRDAWRGAGGGRPGLTCCFDVSLTDPSDQVEKRIDLVMLGNGVRAVSARLVGGRLAARTPGGLWPSDHIGVVASLRIPRRDPARAPRRNRAGAGADE